MTCLNLACSQIQRILVLYLTFELYSLISFISGRIWMNLHMSYMTLFTFGMSVYICLLRLTVCFNMPII